jgi:hypothetical protein
MIFRRVIAVLGGSIFAGLLGLIIVSAAGLWHREEGRATVEAPATSAQQGASGSAPVTTPADNGRFIVVHSPHTEKDVILLDTRTGDSWYLLEYSDLVGHPSVWKAMPQINSPEDEQRLIDAVGIERPKHGGN